MSNEVTVTYEPTDYKGRRFAREFHAQRDPGFGPGWFVFARAVPGIGRDDYGGNVKKMVAWPAGPRRRHRSYNVQVQHGFRTKKMAQEVAAQLEAKHGRQNPSGRHRTLQIPPKSPFKDSIYRLMKKAKVPMDHHESDLYVKATPTALAIARRLGAHYTTFKSGVDGATWMEFPFQYTPHWAASAHRGVKHPRKPRLAARTNPHKPGSADKAAARELLLFTENDGDLYRMQFQPIAKNLTKKFKARKYSSTKAAKLWTYLADNAAKKYTFEMGDSGNARTWHQVKGYGTFSAATRRLVGRLLEKSWHAEMKAGNFHD